MHPGCDLSNLKLRCLLVEPCTNHTPRGRLNCYLHHQGGGWDGLAWPDLNQFSSFPTLSLSACSGFSDFYNTRASPTPSLLVSVQPLFGLSTAGHLEVFHKNSLVAIHSFITIMHFSTLLAAGGLVRLASAAYSLADDFSGDGFFNGFNFETACFSSCRGMGYAKFGDRRLIPQTDTSTTSPSRRRKPQSCGMSPMVSSICAWTSPTWLLAGAETVSASQPARHTNTPWSSLTWLTCPVTPAVSGLHSGCLALPLGQ